jgi:hypothetical protein
LERIDYCDANSLLITKFCEEGRNFFSTTTAGDSLLILGETVPNQLSGCTSFRQLAQESLKNPLASEGGCFDFLLFAAGGAGA